MGLLMKSQAIREFVVFKELVFIIAREQRGSRNLDGAGNFDGHDDDDETKAVITVVVSLVA